MPTGEMLDGLARHVPDVGERWMKIFEGQVQHEHEMAKETLRINEKLNEKNLDMQIAANKNEARRSIFAQVWAGSLLFGGLLFFAGLVASSLWFFKQDKNTAGTVAIAITAAFGYYFRGVFQTYFPTKTKPDAEDK